MTGFKVFSSWKKWIYQRECRERERLISAFEHRFKLGRGGGDHSLQTLWDPVEPELQVEECSPHFDLCILPLICPLPPRSLRMDEFNTEAPENKGIFPRQRSLFAQHFATFAFPHLPPGGNVHVMTCIGFCWDVLIVPLARCSQDIPILYYKCAPVQNNWTSP